MHIVITNPSLVICANHEFLGLFLRCDIESLVVDTLESAIDHCISLLLDLKYMFVQIDVLYTHSLTIDYDVPWYALCRIVFYMLLINQTIHLWSEYHEIGDAMSVMLVFEYRSRQLLVEVKKG